MQDSSQNCDICSDLLMGLSAIILLVFKILYDCAKRLCLTMPSKFQSKDLTVNLALGKISYISFSLSLICEWSSSRSAEEDPRAVIFRIQLSSN